MVTKKFLGIIKQLWPSTGAGARWGGAQLAGEGAGVVGGEEEGPLPAPGEDGQVGYADSAEPLGVPVVAPQETRKHMLPDQLLLPPLPHFPLCLLTMEIGAHGTHELKALTVGFGFVWHPVLWPQQVERKGGQVHQVERWKR